MKEKHLMPEYEIWQATEFLIFIGKDSGDRTLT